MQLTMKSRLRASTQVVRKAVESEQQLLSKLKMKAEKLKSSTEKTTKRHRTLSTSAVEIGTRKRKSDPGSCSATRKVRKTLNESVRRRKSEQVSTSKRIERVGGSSDGKVMMTELKDSEQQAKCRKSLFSGSDQLSPTSSDTRMVSRRTLNKSGKFF